MGLWKNETPNFHINEGDLAILLRMRSGSISPCVGPFQGQTKSLLDGNYDDSVIYCHLLAYLIELVYFFIFPP